MDYLDRRAFLLISGFIFCGFIFFSCATTPHSLASKEKGKLYILCDHDDAQIYIDDRYLGVASSFKKSPITLRVGNHRIEVQKKNYFNSYHDIKIASGMMHRLTIHLQREPL